MRQQVLSNPNAFDIVDAPLAAKVTEERPQSEPAAPDMPKAIGVFMITAYAAIIAAFLITIRGARADFAIAISAFYLAMFFAIPAVFLGIERKKTRPDLVQFLDRGLDTATGHLGGSAALVQMLVVPVLLAFAVLAMGITYLLV